MMRRARDAEEQAGHSLQAPDDTQHTISGAICFFEKQSRVSYVTLEFDLHQALFSCLSVPVVLPVEADVFLLPCL